MCALNGFNSSDKQTIGVFVPMHRCDVPEAISARRAQDTHAEGFATRADLGAEGVVTDSPHVLPEQADAPPSQ